MQFDQHQFTSLLPAQGCLDGLFKDLVRLGAADETAS